MQRTQLSGAVLLTALLLLGMSSLTDAQTAATAPNILVIIGDDMGVETIGRFGIGEDPASTPTLDSLADRGIIFTNTWSQAMCSPTRATILSGRYGFRTGVGSPTGRDHVAGPLPDPPPYPAGVLEVPQGPDLAAALATSERRRPGAVNVAGPIFGASWGLRSDEAALPGVLAARTNSSYDTAAFGKWHLADKRNGWENHPNLIGFDHFSGLISCCTQSFFGWQHLENGVFSNRTGYGPSDKVDDAIDWFGEPGARDEPWFLWLAFNTPHWPIHMPPEDLVTGDYSDITEIVQLEPNGTRVLHAMLEAMDAEIGRLLDHIGPEELDNTYVIFIGDNGTDNRVITPPFEPGRAKGSLYNGGIHVPLLIAGPGIAAGSVSTALINSADLYATILELAGVDVSEVVPDDMHVDSVSLVPYFSAPQRDSIRDWIYADSFITDNGFESGSHTIRNERYKLLSILGEEEFYDLQADPYEHSDLLLGEMSDEQMAALRELRARIEALRSSEKQ